MRDLCGEVKDSFMVMISNSSKISGGFRQVECLYEMDLDKLVNLVLVEI
jgi:hypothetical protein